MRIAVFSDIHANLEALQAVMEDAHEQQCRDFICLGDVVGYNANPHECVEIVRNLSCPVVKGNHDEHASLDTPLTGFNELAERAMAWTRDNLTTEDKQWLRNMRMVRQVRDFTIVHATLDTPEQWGYVFNNLDAVASFTYQHTTICFYGHTHVPTVYVRDDNVTRSKIDQLTIDTSKKYFINTGSVGQPRDGDWRAAYCVYHVDKNVVEQRRVKYDLATAQKKIAEADLPHLLADRLAVGR
jgi:predicted phosphodiesterase